MPQMTYPSDGRDNEAPKIVGYMVSNSLTVRIRDLARLGAVIDRSVTLGVNQGGQIVFTHSDPSPVIEAARAGAMKDAVRRASVLAEAAGGKVGRVLLIAEPPAASDPVPLKRLEMAMRTADAVPVAAGENTYRVTVNAVFELDQ
jgi:uncharacterized protein YggE